jgi:molybdopterin converting factor small subunit
MVEVRIFGAPWKHLAPRLELDLEGRDVRVADLIARLDIDPIEVGIVTVDRRQSGLDEIVPADSRVCIFPPMFGG